MAADKTGSAFQAHRGKGNSLSHFCNKRSANNRPLAWDSNGWVNDYLKLRRGMLFALSSAWFPTQCFL